MTPLTAFLLFLLAVELGWYVRFKQGCHADDKAWADCQRRLRALGERPFLAGSSNYIQIQRDPYEFSFEPGAIWPVSDPSDVAVLA